MNSHLTRGELLYSHGRYDAAEAEIRKALTEAPDDPLALSLLAMVIVQQGRRDEALATAREAVGQGPDLPFTHYALALVHVECEELLKAKAAIDEALRLDREDADFWAVLASIHAARGEFVETLEAARSGLEIDPEHAGCRNLKAVALTQLGRHDEAAATIKGQLQEDPDDAMAHANQGWAHLHQNRTKEAAVHFREALRLDPELEFARAGMLNALRARNPIFRVLLAYFLWMSRLSSGVRWAIVIGGYLLYRAVRGVGAQHPELRYWTIPVLVLYGLFVYLTWTGPTLANLLLRLDRFGRHVLSNDELLATNFVGASLLLAVASGLAALFTGELTFLMATPFFLVMVIPLSGTFSTDPNRGRTTLAIYTMLLFVLGAGSVATIRLDRHVGALLLILFLLGIFAFSFVANAIHMRKPS